MRFHPRARGGPAQRLLSLLPALLILAWVAAACTPSTPPPPTAGTGSPAPANPTTANPAATVAPGTSAPAGTSGASQQAVPTAGQPAVDLSKLPTGVDADGNFYRGDPNAPVKLVDFSDFQ